MGSEYLRQSRLADVLALIQVLALDKDAHRSDAGLQQELQGKPHSASSWSELAKHHPEFFRVNEESEWGTSLIARHVIPEQDGRRELENAFIQTLLGIAVDMHDREVRRSDRWWQLGKAALAGFAGGLIPYIPRLLAFVSHHI